MKAQFTDISELSEKKHNTATTSRESFVALLNEGKLIDQKRTIYEAIAAHGAVTSRKLAEITQQERSSVCRSLYDLQNEINPSIKVAFMDKCPVTLRKVKFYSVINYQRVKQLSIYE
jgi:hypothetical protein